MVQRFFVSMLPAPQVAMLATKLYGLRLAMWLSASLMVALNYAVGMIDGLVAYSGEDDRCFRLKVTADSGRR